MFKRVIGKKCSDISFVSCDVIVDSSLNTCNQCDGPLRVVEATDKRIVAALGLAIVLSIGGFAYLALSVKSYMAAEDRPDDRQVTRTVDETSHREIGNLLRSIYSDGIKTVDEQTEIASLARRHAVDQAWLARQEQDVKDRSDRASISLRKGITFAAQQDYSNAVREFKKSTDIDPDNALLWANLAAAHIKLNELDSAESACIRAVALDSHNWLAHYNLGALKASRGDKDTAIAELSEALRLVTEDKSRQITKADVAGHMKADQSLSSLRKDPRFLQLLARN